MVWPFATNSWLYKNDEKATQVGRPNGTEVTGGRSKNPQSNEDTRKKSYSLSNPSMSLITSCFHVAKILCSVYGVYFELDLYEIIFLVGLISGPWGRDLDFTLKELTYRLGFSPVRLCSSQVQGGLGEVHQFNPKFTNVHIYNSDISLLFKGIGNLK